MKPTSNSLPMRRMTLELGVMSLVASARTVTVITWTPALPPMAAVIGISTARAG